MRLFGWILSAWLLAWPATVSAVVSLEPLPAPVLPDLGAREAQGQGAVAPIDGTNARLESAAIGVRLGEQSLLLGRIEQAAVTTSPGESFFVGGLELAYRHDLFALGGLSPFVSTGVGFLGSGWEPLAFGASGIESDLDLETQMRVVAGLDMALAHGWAAEARLPVRLLVDQERLLAAATLSVRTTF